MSFWRNCGNLTTRKVMIFGMLAVLLAFCGCMPPKISMMVDRPPVWNTGGMKRIAVMQFENSRPGGGDIANHLTQQSITMIQGTGHFTIVSSDEVDRLERSGESLANHVDAILTGKIMNITADDKVHTSQSRDKDGNLITYTSYTRDVSLEISYTLHRTRDGSLVGTATRNGSQRATSSSSSGLPAVSQMLRNCNVLRSLVSDVAPHKVRVDRQIMADKSNKDKVFQESMKTAAKQVELRNYRAALTSYQQLSEQHNSFAALMNLATMQEAVGDIPGAIASLEKAEAETGNPAASARIAELRQIVADKETVKTVHKEAVRPIEKASAHAVSEAISHLPDGARVWILNNSNNERELVSSVADNMTSSFIQNGITTVDRENIKLIESELMQQFSGSVSDDDILNAGRQAGANTIIILAVSGTGSMRRLQMRVLDVERGVPLFQSDTGNNWEM